MLYNSSENTKTGNRKLRRFLISALPMALQVTCQNKKHDAILRCVLRMRAHPVTHWKVSGDEGHWFCKEVRKYCKVYHHLKKNNNMNGTAAERALTRSREIPSRRVLVSDPSLMPHDYSTTPGGTIFSTTPGGEPCFYSAGKVNSLVLLLHVILFRFAFSALCLFLELVV